MNVTLHLSVWGALVVITTAIALYRRWLENHDDHYIHLHNDALDSRIINSQTVMARRIDILDKLTKVLIAVIILYALAVGGISTYMAWNNS